MNTQIFLIEDDVDGVTVIVAAPDQETLMTHAVGLWEEFCAYPNKNYSTPAGPGVTEFTEDGGLSCSFNVSYPKRVAQEVLEDWLNKKVTSFTKDEQGDGYNVC